MEYGYIYKTTNLINGMIYIGQNRGSLKLSYLGSGVYIRKAIKKYGKENFLLEVLAFATTKPMLDALEMKYIYEYRQVFGKGFLYNIADGGGGPNGFTPWNKGKKGCVTSGSYKKGCLPTFGNLGKKVSSKTKEVISFKLKGRKLPEIVKDKISNTCKEKGIGLWMIGKKQSKETISKKLESFRKTISLRKNLTQQTA